MLARKCQLIDVIDRMCADQKTTLDSENIQMHSVCKDILRPSVKYVKPLYQHQTLFSLELRTIIFVNTEVIIIIIIIIITIIILSVTQQPSVGQGLLIAETLRLDTSHSVRIILKCYQPVSETST